MKPLFNSPTRDPVRDLRTLEAALNRPAFRTQHILTPVDAYRDGTDTPTYYTPAHTPFEDGEVFRMARLLAAEDYRIARTGAYIRIAAGVRGPGTFRLLGTEWDSRVHGLKVGTPFVLCRDETKIPEGAGLALRVVRSDFPTVALLGASVEWSIGYEGGS